jgi:hypothetical protein
MASASLSCANATSVLSLHFAKDLQRLFPVLLYEGLHPTLVGNSRVFRVLQRARCRRCLRWRTRNLCAYDKRKRKD